MCHLKSEYTQYRIGQVAGLKSTYSIRLFELLIQFKKLGDRTISLKKFREWFRIEKKYKRYADINKWVIKPAVDELNVKTALNVKYESIKKGRKVISVYFAHEEVK